MTEKEKIDALLAYSETHRGEFNKRRSLEWRIVFTILTFYALCMAARFTDKSKLPDDKLFRWAVWIIFLSIAGIHSLFAMHVSYANHKNKTRAENAENNVIKLIFDEKITNDISNSEDRWVGGPPWCKNNKGIWGWVFESLMVITFGVFAAWAMTAQVSIRSEPTPITTNVVVLTAAQGTNSFPQSISLHHSFSSPIPVQSQSVSAAAVVATNRTTIIRRR